MAQSHSHEDLYLGKFSLPSWLKMTPYILFAIGLITFAVGLMQSPQRAWSAFLTAFFFFACLGVGGLFFAAINHLTKAGWSVTVRRLAEGLTSYLPAMAVGAVILFVGAKILYSWADAEKVAADHLLQLKSAYLNPGFFAIRLVVFCGGLLLFKKWLVGGSLRQDLTGDENITHKSVGYSIAFVLFFAIFFSLFSVDLLMSLLPTWYSTIFGVYCFAGLFQSTMAALSIIIVLLRRSGLVRGYITEEHQHDVAKFMKAFTVFWAYIAFSQFMLIWYANIPEETEYYIMRSQHGWLWISLGLLFFRFIFPFLVLLPRGSKRNGSVLIAVSVLILVMQYVDIYWMVYPNFFEGQLLFGFWEIGIFLGFAGVFLFTLFRFFEKHNLVPIKDPRLHEALDHHVTY